MKLVKTGWMKLVLLWNIYAIVGRLTIQQVKEKF
jgi:hypothetical protein